MSATSRSDNSVPLAAFADLEAANRAALQALREYADHQSWRCEHPPHYYLAGDPPADGDCACGLLSTLKALGIDRA